MWPIIEMILQITLFPSHMFNGWSIGLPQYHRNHHHHHPHHQGMVQAEDNPSISLYTPPVPPPFAPIHPPCTHRQNFVFVLVFAFVFVLVFVQIHPSCKHIQNFVFALVYRCIYIIISICPKTPFPQTLHDNFVTKSVLYVTKEINRFPSWTKEIVLVLYHLKRRWLERVFAFNDVAVKPSSLLVRHRACSYDRGSTYFIYKSKEKRRRWFGVSPFLKSLILWIFDVPTVKKLLNKVKVVLNFIFICREQLENWPLNI